MDDALLAALDEDARRVRLSRWVLAAATGVVVLGALGTLVWVPAVFIVTGRPSAVALYVLPITGVVALIALRRALERRRRTAVRDLLGRPSRRWTPGPALSVLIGVLGFAGVLATRVVGSLAIVPGLLILATWADWAATVAPLPAAAGGRRYRLHVLALVLLIPVVPGAPLYTPSSLLGVLVALGACGVLARERVLRAAHRGEHQRVVALLSGGWVPLLAVRPSERAMLLLAADRLEDAEQTLLLSLGRSRSDDWGAGLAALAEARAGRGDVAGAMAAADTALRAAPADARSWAARGERALASGDPATAVPCLERARTLGARAIRRPDGLARWEAGLAVALARTGSGDLARAVRGEVRLPDAASPRAGALLRLAELEDTLGGDGAELRRAASDADPTGRWGRIARERLASARTPDPGR